MHARRRGLPQPPVFPELRRWRLQSPDGVCGAAHAAGKIAALGRRVAVVAGPEVVVLDVPPAK